MEQKASIKRLLVDIRHLAESSPTGVNAYTTQLLKTLKRDRSLELILFFSGSRKAKALLPKAITAMHVRYRAIPSKLLKLLFLLRLTTIEKLTGIAVDAVLLPNHAIVHTKRPFLLTVHDISPKLFPHFFTLKDRLYFALSFNRLLGRAWRVLAVSESTKQDLEAVYKVPASKIYVTLLGGSAQLSPAPNPSDRSHLRQYPAAQPYFFYLGTLEPRKNIETLIEAFTQFKTERPELPHQLLIAGKRGWKTRPIFAAMKNSAAAASIHYLGYIPHNHRGALLRGATAFVFPSYYEGFGLPVLEALECGTPIITSFTSSLPEVGGDVPIYIDPFNVSDCAAALARAIKSEPELRRSPAAKRQAAQFSWHKTAEQTKIALN